MTADANNPKLDEDKVIRKLSLVGIVGNVFLSAFKFFAGIIGNSSAMVSDAVHSLSDVFATIIALIGVRCGRRAARRHRTPTGTSASRALPPCGSASILLVTGIGIGWVGLEKIIAGNYESLPIPGMIALIAAIVSIAVKEGMFWYTRHWARAIRSSAFEADACIIALTR